MPGWLLLTPLAAASDPDLLLLGEQDFGWLGHAAAAGDIDGDGRRDLLLATLWRSDDEPGGVALHRGTEDGPSLAPAYTWIRPVDGGGNYAWDLAAGDLDGDGDDEVVVSAHNGVELYDPGLVYVYAGGTVLSDEPMLVLEGREDSDWFGISLATVDTNRDGYDDLVVGAPRHRSSGGRAYLYLGGPGGLDPSPARTWRGEDYAELGTNVASAGDVNGDGYEDVVLAAPRGVAGNGAMHVFHGGPGGPGPDADTVIEGALALSYFGYSATGIGDLNADGYDDVACATWPPQEAHQVRVHLGGPDGVERFAVRTWFDVGLPEGALGVPPYGGTGITSLDFDADGFTDVVVGSPTGAGGRAYLFEGGPGPVPQIPERVWEATAPDDGFGEMVLGVGDLDGDGAEELLVAAIHDSRGAEYGGAVHVFAGVCPDGDADGSCVDDCDPDDELRFPGAPERCNGLDDACAGFTPDDELDVDDDGERPCEGDCDDADPARSSDAEERCNDVDDDCDGEVDEGACPTDGPRKGGPARSGCGCTLGGSRVPGLLLLTAGLARRRRLASA